VQLTIEHSDDSRTTGHIHTQSLCTTTKVSRGPIFLGIAVLSLPLPVLADPTPAWVNSLTPTFVQDTDYNGEAVEITVVGGTVAGCSLTDFYVLRDTATIHGGLSLAIAALVASRKLDLYVTGACDPTGRPLISCVTMH
jgi:hypothetical protein